MPSLSSSSASPTSCFRQRLILAAALILNALPLAHAGPKPGTRPGDPALTLPAETYGYLPLPPRYLASGLSMFTLHFVDETHLLFTFHTRGLLERLPDANPDDEDRRVTAVLIELPSGKELARTVWRTRDQNQYLWPLGHGRFVLRIRSRLTVLDPMHGLAHGDTFFEHPFLDFKRRIGYLSVSPGGDLLSVETIAARSKQPADADPQATEEEPSAKAAVEIRFYRLAFRDEDEPGKPERVLPRVAGGLAVQNMVHIPATSEGFLDITKDKGVGYLFDFQSHSGKRIELAGYETTCIPRTYFISRSEFVAFGCQTQDKPVLSEFNLRGEEPWVQVLQGSYTAPIITSAPAAGRFVLSRLMVSGSYVDLDNLLPEELAAQELTILQNHDGRVLLKTQASPIQRAGQNFDLSPDGLSFATVQSTQTTHSDETTQHTRIVVYHLPGLTSADEKQLKLAADSIPEKSEAPIRLLTASQARRQDATPAITVRSGAAATPVATRTATQAANEGDATDEQPRKKPSLYDADHPKPPNP